MGADHRDARRARRLGASPPLLVADVGYKEATSFKLALTEREIQHAVAVTSSTSVHSNDAMPAPMDDNGRGPRPRTIRYQDAPISVKGRVTGNPEAAMTSRFAARRVRPANRNNIPGDDGTLPVEWLIAEWPDGSTEPTHY